LKILLIGHQGYVGAGLFRYLGTHHQVVGWDREDDVCSLNTSIIKGLKVAAVVNCAAVINRASANFALDSDSDRVNVGGTRALVSALNGTDIKLIQISTKDVFGNVYSRSDVDEEQYSYKPKFLVDDSQPFAPETIYGKTKLMGEFVAESHPQTVVIRLSTCYTDFDHHRGSWAVKIMKALLQGKPVTVTNTGKQFRDPLNADDLGRLIDLILESDRYDVKINAGGGALESDRYDVKINAGGGAGNILSILEFIRMLNPDAEIIKTAGSDYGFAFNNRLAGELFGWKPRILFASRIPVIRENIIAQRSAEV